jgi:sporulation protein YlmC with PRC-barrel domain
MTRLTATAIAALLALGTSGAFTHGARAQSMSTPPSDAKSAATDKMNAPSDRASDSSSARMKDPLASEDISQIAGTSVAGSDGGKIGKVSTVLMNPSTKRVDRLVVAEGGVLGVGSRLVALPVDSFRWDAQNQNFIVQKTADDLKAMPEWQRPQLAETPAPSAAPSINPSAGAAAGGVPVAPMPPDAPSAATPAH